MTAWARKNRVLLRRCRITGLLLGGLLLALSQQSRPARTRAADDPPEVAKAAANPAKGGESDKPKRLGHLLKIELPITGETFTDVRRFVRRAIDKAQAEGHRPTLIFEFAVRKDQSQYGRGSEFGASADLARFLTSKEVSAAQTVAYVPDSIQGHAVLVVLACDEIIMGPKAEIGSAGIDEKTIDPSLLSTYREIAGRRMKVPVDVAVALLDPAQKVYEVKTESGGVEYVSPEGLEKLRKDKTIVGEPRVLIPAGQPGHFTGAEARGLRFVSYLASNPSEVARALELPPEAVEEDLSLKGDWVPLGVPIRGPIDVEKVRQAQRLIQDAVLDRNVNFVCLWIESPGGSPSDSIQLANYLALDLKASEIRTVAYIPTEARSDAALIALACDQVVMRPRAILGGPGAYELSKEDIQVAVESIRNRNGAWKHRSWSLVAAIVDPELDVFRYTRDGDEEHFCQEEAEEVNKDLPPARKWVKAGQIREQVVRPGSPLKVDGKKARDYRLAYRVVEDFAGFRELYSLKEDLDLAEPGWAEFLIDALASPGAAGLLLMIGFFALYAELHSPGIGIGGFLATVCFLLFFWSRFLGGTAGWLEGILFVSGVGCLLLEIFVLPGFGIFGLGGGLLVIASLILASQTFILPRNEYQFGQFQRSLLILTGATLGVFAAAYVARRWLPSAPVFSRMFLQPPAGEEADTIRRREALVHFQDLVGTQGTTTTQLTPSGKARFGNRLVDVIADGELIERGTDIVVVEVYGNRVLVRAADEQA